MKYYLYTNYFDILEFTKNSYLSSFDSEEGAREHIKKEIVESKREARKYNIKQVITAKSFALIKGEEITIKEALK
jgi:hypothetical protein